TGKPGTEDFQTNLARLHETSIQPHYIHSEENFPVVASGTVIIDAIYGTGLNRPAEGSAAKLIKHINAQKCAVIAIDLPSGLNPDHSSKNNTVITATHTLSFQCFKPAFLLPENEDAIGQLHILDIGLEPGYIETLTDTDLFISKDIASQLFRKRKSFSHKGDYGHAAIIAGSKGMMGAAVLSAKACLRSGAGKLTCFIPACGCDIVQTSLPEAMVITAAENDYIGSVKLNAKYSAIGIGPGLGNHSANADLLASVFDSTEYPMVIDADALNTLATHKTLLEKIPSFSILTPHPAEFARVFGESSDDYARIEQASAMAVKFGVIIILKGHYTLVAMPGGKKYFNSTGNAGMAKGGSGDVLTGILTGLLSQRYPPEAAALLGVYIHGKAGDFAAAEHSQEAMLATDIIDCLGKAFYSFQP
ncbi:MAG: NAD(P)H-hydrate dehydratase, partial [Gemmatimonadaceae bacterium]|nr:NAD(P)H-hydrate dehydratase [Chitinophagaceae bacterium]